MGRRAMARTIAERIAELERLDRPALQARWAEVFGRASPSRMSRDLLLRSLAYYVQERAEGGLRKAALRHLRGSRDASGNVDHKPTPRGLKLRPGTRLVREWRGNVYQVAVLDGGFDYHGERFTSLSQIARRITGTRWSGPAFFGLRPTGSPAKERGHER